MRYLYYIIVIFILATAGFALLRQDKASVDVSRPAITINDRIITESELKKRMDSKPHDMTDDQYIDSLIMQELLIQEALEQNIHREESFRRSVENYYEQSLVKVLLDRKSRQAEPAVTEKEVKRYIELSGMEIDYTKRVYQTKEDAQTGRDSAATSASVPFEFLSDSLQCIMAGLEPGQTSAPRQTDDGFVTYTLEKTRPLKSRETASDMNEGRIKDLIADWKKEKMYEQWTDELKEKADIWRRR